MASKISILIPAYNAEEHIQETLESIKKQNKIADLIQRILVVDDCSTDKTVENIKAFQTNNAHLPVELHSMDKNSGERTAVNTGMKILEKVSDWVLILHADDIAYPQWVEKMFEFIEKAKPNTGSVSSGWNDLHQDGTITRTEINEYRSESIYFDGGLTRARDTILMGGWWHVSGCAIRLKMVHEIGGFHSLMPQLGDIEFVVKCFKSGWAIEYYPQPLILYRQHSQSVSSRSFRVCRDLSEMLYIMKVHSEILVDSDKSLLKKRVMKNGLRRLLGGFKRLDPLQISSSISLLKQVITGPYELR